MRKNPDAITSLNTLVAVNAKRFERYKHAADRTKDLNRKLMLMNYAVQSQEFIAHLNKWLIAYGTFSAPVTNHSGENFLSRTWTGLREKLSSGERRYLLNGCEAAERESLKVYKEILKDDSLVLPSAMQADLQRQVREIEYAHVLLKSMRDMRAMELQVA